MRNQVRQTEWNGSSGRSNSQEGSCDKVLWRAQGVTRHGRCHGHPLHAPKEVSSCDKVLWTAQGMTRHGRCHGHLFQPRGFQLWWYFVSLDPGFWGLERCTVPATHLWNGQIELQQLTVHVTCMFLIEVDYQWQADFLLFFTFLLLNKRMLISLINSCANWNVWPEWCDFVLHFKKTLSYSWRQSMSLFYTCCCTTGLCKCQD